MNFLKAVAILCLFFFGMILPALSQTAIEDDHSDIFRQIEKDFQDGELTLAQKIRYKFHAGRQSKELPKEYQQKESADPLKCGTPATVDLHRNRHELPEAMLQELSPGHFATAQQVSESYISPSGNFEIQYETSGSHAVPGEDIDGNGTPDYVEEVALAADSSYRHMVQTMGYTDPITAGDPYQIEILNLIYIYGQTYTTNGTTAIQVENDFSEDFPSNDHPDGDQIGAIKATIAHEFKHAIQYAASAWAGETGNWLEMDATLMEEVVYDEVNDYYNYIRTSDSIFKEPQNSFYPGSYYHVSWALYFEEKFGSEFWPQVWNIIKTDPEVTLVEAVAQQLGGEEAFHKAYTESQLWHYASGSNATEEYGFEEAAHYPDPSATEEQLYTEDFSIPRSVSSLSPLSNFSAQYYNIPLPDNVSGNISVEISSEEKFQGVGVIAYTKEGVVGSVYSSDETFLTTEARFEDTEQFGLILSNSSTSESTGRTIVGIGPDVENPSTVTLHHNYPNPFSSTTQIRFTVDEPTQVTLKIIDVAGRLVQTLIDEELEAGVYEPTFDGSELASGVYLYQLITEEQMFVEKMTLIK